MSWRQITDTYGATGVIRLGSWSIETIHSDLVACRATLAVGDRILSLESVATGPIGAMTAILGDLGAPVQIMRFHQRTLVEGGVATFLLCENGGRRTWAAGEGRTAPEAGINALVAGAGRLLAG